MDELLKGLARLLCVRGERRHKFLADKGLPCHDCGKQEDALRDAGLGELLEAGQAMRAEWMDISSRIRYDAALAKFAAIAGEGKGRERPGELHGQI